MKALTRRLAALVFVLIAGAGRSTWAGEGVFDTAFGSGGKLQFPPAFGALAVLPDGRLQLHSLEGGRLRVARLTRQGQPDPSFGVSGMLDSGLALSGGNLRVATVLDDGSVLLGANVKRTSRTGTDVLDLVLVRLTPGGEIDRSFGEQGALSLPADDAAGADSLYLEKLVATVGGRMYLLVGYMKGGVYGCMIEERVYGATASGATEAVFQSNGTKLPFLKMTADCSDLGYSDLWLLADDRLIVEGSSSSQLFESGIPVPFPSNAAGSPGRSEIVGRDASSVFTEDPIEGSSTRVSIARWHMDLSADTNFGGAGDGRAIVDFPGLVQQDYAVWPVHVVHGAGPGSPFYLIAGLARARGSGSLPLGSAVARLDAEGRLDKSFGDEGVLLLPSESPPPVWALPGEDADLILENPYGHNGDFAAMRLAGHQDLGPGFIWVRDYLCAGKGIEEDAGAYTVRLRRMLGSSGPVTIGYRTGAGTAIPGSDYQDVAGTLAWAAGEAGEKEFQIPILRDSVSEAGEPLKIQFDMESGAAVLACNTATLSIDDAVGVAPAGPVSKADEAGGGGSLGLETWVALLAAMACRSGRSIRVTAPNCRSARVNTKSAIGAVASTPDATLLSVMKIMANAGSAKLSGKYKETPFFDIATMQPIAEPQVISKEERQRLRGAA